jgi:hypothetical protein
MNIDVKEYPQLTVLCWNRDKNVLITEEDALGLYENNWRWVEELTQKEQKFLDRLVIKHGNGVLLT